MLLADRFMYLALYPAEYYAKFGWKDKVDSWLFLAVTHTLINTPCFLRYLYKAIDLHSRI